MQSSTPTKPREKENTSLFGLINSDKNVSLQEMQDALEITPLKQQKS